MNDETELGILKERIDQLIATVEEFRSDLKQLVQFDKAIAELFVHKNNAEQNYMALWKRVDELKRSDDTLRSDTDKAKGGIAMMQYLLAAAATVVFAFNMWVASSIVAHAEKLATLETRVNLNEPKGTKDGKL